MLKSVTASIVLSALLLAVGGFAQAATIGYWQFNEKAPGQQAAGTAGEIIDSSGNGHNGTAVGNPLPSYVAGLSDPTSAIVLQRLGSAEDPPLYENEDRVVIPHSADFNLMLADQQDYTIEALVKLELPAETRSAQGIMTKRGTAGMGWSFRTNFDGQVSFYVEGTGNNFLHPGAHGNTSILDDEWHHVAAVIDADADSALTSVTFYVDHEADGTVLFKDEVYKPSEYPWFNQNIVNENDVLIGDFIGRASDQLVGAVDAIRFSTGKLTPDEFLDVVPEPGVILTLFIGAVALLAGRAARRFR